MSFRKSAAAAAVLLVAWAQPAAAVLYSRTLTVVVPFLQTFTITNLQSNNPTVSYGTAPTILLAQFGTNLIGGSARPLSLTGVAVSLDRDVIGNMFYENGSGNARTLQFNIAAMTSSFTATAVNLSSPLSLATPLQTVNIPAQSQGISEYLGLGGGRGATAASVNQTVNFNAVNLSPAQTMTGFAPYIGQGNISFSHGLSNLLGFLDTTVGGKGNPNVTVNGTVSGSLAVTYSWLDPVPEPQSWALLLAGFGLVGATARHQRRQAA